MSIILPLFDRYYWLYLNKPCKNHSSKCMCIHMQTHTPLQLLKNIMELKSNQFKENCQISLLLSKKRSWVLISHSLVISKDKTYICVILAQHNFKKMIVKVKNWIIIFSFEFSFIEYEISLCRVRIIAIKAMWTLQWTPHGQKMDSGT